MGRFSISLTLLCAVLSAAEPPCGVQTDNPAKLDAFLDDVRPPRSDNQLKIPTMWEYSAPLIAPEKRNREPSRAQKDPTVVFHEGRWHVFMTVKLPGRSAIEYCSFISWEEANSSQRRILDISDSEYYCAPQVFYFTPHKKWYLVYQMGVPGKDKMWVAYSTTSEINNPSSWTGAKPILDGGQQDSRETGGLDYWIICDEQRAYLFFTSLNGKMWRMSVVLVISWPYETLDPHLQDLLLDLHLPKFGKSLK